MALVVDIFKMLIIDKDGDVLATDTLTESSIAVTTETTDVTGGRGDQLIAILNGRREIEITNSDPIWRMEVMAKHLGQDIVVGAGEAYAMPKEYTVTNNGTSDLITLDQAPVSDAELRIYDKDGKLIADTNYLLSGSEVTFSGGAVEGDKVEVRTFKYATSAETSKIDIDVTKFPKDVKIVLETLEISEDQQPLAKLQFEYPRVRPSADFNMNTSSAVEQSNQETTFRVLKPTGSDVIGNFKRIPIA